MERKGRAFEMHSCDCASDLTRWLAAANRCETLESESVIRGVFCIDPTARHLVVLRDAERISCHSDANELADAGV